MAKSYRSRGEPLPCSHGSADALITKIYKGKIKVPEGDSYFIVFNCSKCGQYERYATPDEFTPEVRRMLDKEGEIFFLDSIGSMVYPQEYAPEEHPVLYNAFGRPVWDVPERRKA